MLSNECAYHCPCLPLQVSAHLLVGAAGGCVLRAGPRSVGMEHHRAHLGCKVGRRPAPRRLGGVCEFSNYLSSSDVATFEYMLLKDPCCCLPNYVRNLKRTIDVAAQSWRCCNQSMPSITTWLLPQSRALIHMTRVSAIIMIMYLALSMAVGFLSCCCSCLSGAFATGDEENLRYVGYQQVTHLCKHTLTSKAVDPCPRK